MSEEEPKEVGRGKPEEQTSGVPDEAADTEPPPARLAISVLKIMSM